MTGKDLFNILISQKVQFPESEGELVEEFNQALRENRVYYIWKNDNMIGFLTHEIRTKLGHKKLLINKLVILKEFRDRLNLVPLRNYIRELYRDMDCDGFYFRSKRRSRISYLT